MIKTISEVQIYDENAKFTIVKESIKVRSHWNNARAVELEIDSKRYKVYASDMIAAIENAINTNRY